MSYSLDEFANGQLHDITNEGIKRVIANIHDREVPAEKPRKIIITLSFEADERREEAVVTVSAQTKLVDKPVKSTATKIPLVRQKAEPEGQMSLEDFEAEEQVDNVIKMRME